MRKCAYFWVVVVILAFQVGTLTGAQAEVAGRLTLVEGRVDILRGGHLPATAAKVGDEVQSGDVIRTKSLSKAQITFIDNTIMTISPEGRVAIEAYMFDPVKKKRNAVIQLFQGLAHIVVNKVFKTAEPDFIVKTNTAIMGVRGTDFGIRIQPYSSTILNRKGRLQVGNIFPEVSQLSRKAFKVAYSFGPEGGPGWVTLDEWQGTTVFWGLPPTKAFKFRGVDWQLFEQQLKGGPDIFRRHTAGYETSGGGGPSVSGDASITGGQGTETGMGLGGLFSGFLQTLYTPAYTPPKIKPTELLSSEGGTTEPSGTTEEEETKPPCDHKCHHRCHRYYRHHFCCDRHRFCDRDHDGPFGFPCAWHPCRPGDHDGQFRFPFNWSFCRPGDHDGQFRFPFNWSFCRSGDHDGQFGFFFNRQSCRSGDHDGQFRFPFNWNSCRSGDRDGQFGFFFNRQSCRSGDHDGQFGFPFNWNSCRSGDHDGQFGNPPGWLRGNKTGWGEGCAPPGLSISGGLFGSLFAGNFFIPGDHDGQSGSLFAWNSCRRGENHGRFEHCRATNQISHHFADPPGWLRGNKTGWGGGSTPPGLLTSHHNLRNFCRNVPILGHFRGPGQGPTITNFIRHCPMTNPTIFLSRRFPAIAPTLPGGMPGHQRCPQVAQRLKPRLAAHQRHGPCGQVNHGPCGPVNHGPCGPVNHGPCGPVNHGPCGQVNHGPCGPHGPNSSGPPGQNLGLILGHTPKPGV
jgi:hypothetical protein